MKQTLCVLTSALLLAGAATIGQEGEIAGRIIGTAVVEEGAYAKLIYLTDRIGHRLGGSENLEKAIRWAVAEFERDGIVQVRTERVMVPHWVRRSESAEVVSPANHRLAISSLGRSVGTPPEGITAEVVEVSSFEELEELGDDKIEGKIVLFNKEIVRNGGRERGYGSAAGLRVRGAMHAARYGAVGVLVRSLGTANYRLPHTGMMRYEDGGRKIPAAAVAAEDAELIHRFLASGDPVTVKLRMDCENLPDAASANIVADLPGREKPDELVLIGCHLDSWDVGTGATDDGVGCAMVMDTMRILRKIDPAPRRTVRAVLYTAEETGIQGGRQYVEDHADEIGRHTAALEADSGAGAVTGIGVSAGDGGIEVVRKIGEILAGMGVSEVSSGGGGSDISPLAKAGIPTLSFRQNTTYYFDYHHSAADTLDKVDREILGRNTAAMAVLTYMLADLEEPLQRPGLQENLTR